MCCVHTITVGRLVKEILYKQYRTFRQKESQAAILNFVEIHILFKLLLVAPISVALPNFMVKISKTTV